MARSKRTKSKALLLAALATPTIIAPFLFAPNSVSAQVKADGPECNNLNHCYGIAEYDESAFKAVGQELWTDCLVLDPPVTGDFATHEMWLLFPGSPQKWLESGYIKGGPLAGGMTQVNFRYFWAEDDGSTFTTHFIGNAPILNYINFSFYKNANGSWGAYSAGVLRGTTLNTNYGNATIVQTGGESNEPHDLLSHGKSRYLQTQNASTGSWGIATRDSSGGTSGVYQVNTNNERMEQLSLQRICNPLPGGPPGTFKAQATDPQALATMARGIAKENGEPAPKKLNKVTTTRRTVGGPTLDTNQKVEVVQLQGKFTLYTTSHPKGTKPPTGDLMTIVFDKATGEVTDLTLESTSNKSTNNKTKDLTKFGAVTPLE